MGSCELCEVDGHVSMLSWTGGVIIDDQKE